MALSAKRPSKAEETRKRLMEDITEIPERKRRLNTDIPDELFRKIKIRAAEEGRTISEITRDLWVEYLNK